MEREVLLAEQARSSSVRCLRDDEEAPRGKDPERHMAPFPARPWRHCAGSISGTRAAAVVACIVVLSLAGAFYAGGGSTPGREAARTGASSGLAGLACTWGRANCNETQCCGAPGMQCYEQDQWYAQCRATCSAGSDPTHWDATRWSCKELGERSPGEPKTCSKPGENCIRSQCCADPDRQCWQKNATYAECKQGCEGGKLDLSDVDGAPWTCNPLGERSPLAQPWVYQTCAGGWESCVDSGCCRGPGEQCYKKNDFYGACMPVGRCLEEGWSCDPVGAVTPSAPPRLGKLSQWALTHCTREYGNCLESKCCLGMGTQCYQKDESYAQCRESCEPGEHAEDNNATWTCDVLSPQSFGLALVGGPSLFCFVVVRPGSYEEGLVAAQHQRGAGIFACDGFSVMTPDANMTLDGVATVAFTGAPIVKSVDNTAGNTWLFVHAWQKVIDGGQWKDHAFTVKADPDAVFLPDRLRRHLEWHVGERVFVVNCPLWDMIYGALEVFSHAAMLDWSYRGKECEAPNDFGEDKYMTYCMDHLNVTRVRDNLVLGDKLCHSFTSCNNLQNAAFHPFKDVDSWLQCLDDALAASPTS